MTKETSNTPTALSLFSGAGGMDLGVSQAGFRILGRIEIDPYCCETLRAWVVRDAVERYLAGSTDSSETGV